MQVARIAVDACAIRIFSNAMIAFPTGKPGIREYGTGASSRGGPRFGGATIAVPNDSEARAAAIPFAVTTANSGKSYRQLWQGNQWHPVAAHEDPRNAGVVVGTEFAGFGDRALRCARVRGVAAFIARLEERAGREGRQLRSTAAWSARGAWMLRHIDNPDLRA